MKTFIPLYLENPSNPMIIFKLSILKKKAKTSFANKFLYFLWHF